MTSAIMGKTVSIFAFNNRDTQPPGKDKSLKKEKRLNIFAPHKPVRGWWRAETIHAFRQFAFRT